MGDLKGAAAQLRKKQRPAGQATAPEENGQRLATIRRRDADELRLNWAEYKGHPFLNIRVLREGDNGAWYPVKDTGLTVRLAKLADFAAGIAEAVELAAQAMTTNDDTRPPGKPQDGRQAPGDTPADYPGAPWYAL